MRAINSRVLAPVAAARVLPVCRRSWKRRFGKPAFDRARSQTLRKELRLIGSFFELGKTYGQFAGTNVPR